MMNQAEVFQEYFTPNALKQLNYELLLTTAEERYGNLQLRSNNPRYPEFVVTAMTPGDICGVDGDDVSEAFIPVTLTVKVNGHRGKNFQLQFPIPGSSKPFGVNDDISALFPTSSIQTLKNFFRQISINMGLRKLSFNHYVFEECSGCSDR